MTKPTGNPTGRPSGLTPALFKQGVELHATAMGQSSVAASMGVSLSTLRLWLKEGARAVAKHEKDGEPIDKKLRRYADFSVKCHRAKSDYIKLHLDNIQKAGGKDWRASHTMLKFLDRERYGDHQRSEISGPSGKPIQVQGTMAEAIAAARKATPELHTDTEGTDDE